MVGMFMFCSAISAWLYSQKSQLMIWGKMQCIIYMPAVLHCLSLFSREPLLCFIFCHFYKMIETEVVWRENRMKRL